MPHQFVHPISAVPVCVNMTQTQHISAQLIKFAVFVMLVYYIYMQNGKEKYTCIVVKPDAQKG